MRQNLLSLLLEGHRASEVISNALLAYRCARSLVKGGLTQLVLTETSSHLKEATVSVGSLPVIFVPVHPFYIDLWCQKLRLNFLNLLHIALRRGDLLELEFLLAEPHHAAWLFEQAGGAALAPARKERRLLGASHLR